MKKILRKFGRYIYISYNFVPVFITFQTPTTQNNTKIIKTMKKKIYTTPALSVEEYEMTIITSASLTSVSTDSSVGIGYGGGGDGTGNSAPQAKGRGIWDED